MTRILKWRLGTSFELLGELELGASKGHLILRSNLEIANCIWFCIGYNHLSILRSPDLEFYMADTSILYLP